MCGYPSAELIKNLPIFKFREPKRLEYTMKRGRGGKRQLKFIMKKQNRNTVKYSEEEYLSLLISFYLTFSHHILIGEDNSHTQFKKYGKLRCFPQVHQNRSRNQNGLLIKHIAAKKF